MSGHTLNRLYERFLSETVDLLGQFSSPAATVQSRFPVPTGSVRLHTGCITPHRYCREMCVVRLYDAWGNFCRELIVQSAGCEPTTKSGIRVPLAPKIAKRNDVIPVLMSTYANRTREPYWPSPYESVDAATRLKIANATTVTSAIGVTPSPLPDLRVVRNFAAHRNEETGREFQRVAATLGLGPSAQVDDAVKTLVVPGIPLFERWVLVLRSMAEAAIF